MKFKILTLLLVVLLSSCKKDESKIFFGYNYFGLTEGNFIEYNAIAIRHNIDLIPKHDTTRYRLKTVVGKDYIDNEGRTAKEFNRYIYDEIDQEWDFLDLYTAIINEGKAELVEENQRKIKLVFAIRDDKVWDANAYSMNNEKLCSYMPSAIHQERKYGSQIFDSTVVVDLGYDSTFYSFKREFEVYANGVGLVELYRKDLKITGDTLNANGGNELFLKVIDFGIE